MAHSKLSPSSAHEWLNCALSVKMRELYSHLDPNRYSVANAQGTIKHGVIEECISHDADPYDFVGKEMRLGDFREDDEDMPQEWCDYIYEFTEDDADTLMRALDRIDLMRGEKHVEYKVNLSKYCGPNQFGTLDLGVVIEIDEIWVDIIIWDNKFGRVGVPAVENLQLMLYALGFYENIVKPTGKRVRNIQIIIWQPYVKGGGGEWDISLKDLLAFGERVIPLAKRALAPNPQANPGPDQCQYCIGGKTMKCTAYVEYNASILKRMFAEGEDLDELVQADEMPCLKYGGVTTELRSWIVSHFSMFERFVNRLEEQMFEDAYYHGNVPGKRLAYGSSSRRKFRNQEAAEKVLKETLKDGAYTKKLISPAQLEKKVGKGKIGDYDHLIDKGEKKLVLVDEDDSRPRVRSIREMFEDE